MPLNASYCIISSRLAVMEDNLQYNVDDAVTVCCFAEYRILVHLLASVTMLLACKALTVYIS